MEGRVRAALITDAYPDQIAAVALGLGTAVLKHGRTPNSDARGGQAPGIPIRVKGMSHQHAKT